eukprot:m.56237 g.56237  ORF g.56237 m.56237 type:complete len:538 (-) comp7662_c0_seq2:158-1771(-)
MSAAAVPDDEGDAAWDVSGDVNWDDWTDAEGVTALEPCADLLAPDTHAGHASPQAALEAARAGGIDVLGIARQHGCDQYGCIRLVNYLRKKIATDPQWRGVPSPEDFAAEDFYMPVIPNDALLQIDYEGILGTGHADDETDIAGEAQGDTVESLRRQLQQLQEAFTQYREVAEPALLGQSRDDMATSGSDEATSREVTTEKDDDASSDGAADDVESYFYSYAHYGIHLEMLGDMVRTEAYRDSMYKNPATYAGKTVLDVGCGTGILSMMAARAGAARVIGVDNSSVVHSAMGIVIENGLSDKVTLVRGKIEEVALPVQEKQVDIIISEWMGYFLFFESMLDSVIHARDKWLKPGGVVYPDKCTLHVAAMSDPTAYQRRVTFWNDVYGFKMTSMAPQVLREVDVRVVDAETIVSAPAMLQHVDIMEAKLDDLEYDSEFTLTVTRDCTVDALCSFFDVDFERGCANPIKLNTAPDATPTHWKQAVFLLSTPLTVPTGGVIEGRMAGKRSAHNPRHWDATLTYSIRGSGTPPITQKFTLG